MSAMVDKKSVVIIGAGAAGIAAATRLYERGIENIIVLEAENRIGGRVHTVNIENGYIEMGADWILGEEGNIVYKSAKMRELVGAPLPTSPYGEHIFVRSSGELIRQELVDRIFDMFDESYTQPSPVDYSESLLSCTEYYKRLFEYVYDKRNNWDISEELRSEIVELCNKWLNSLDANDSWHNVSISDDSEPKICTGQQSLTWNKTGYRALFDILMEESQRLSNGSFKSDVVALNHEVTQISCDERELGVTVLCSNGRKIYADHVIVTIPLGALQEAREALFRNTNIPEHKCSSIDNMESGLVDKIYLQFSERWWPEGRQGFELLWTKRDREEYIQMGLEWVTDIFEFLEVFSAPNTLCASIRGKAAIAMESLSEEIVRDAVVYMLRQILSKGTTLKVPDPVHVFRSTWYSNRHFRGSASYRGRKAVEKRVFPHTLSIPLNNSRGIPVLLFAGEATSPHHFASVHGAVETGYREAERLLLFIEKS